VRYNHRFDDYIALSDGGDKQDRTADLLNAMTINQVFLRGM